MANYYVKNGGSDALDGLSDGNAWETIAKVNGNSFSPGDTISFKCGSTWREKLIIPSEGSSSNRITFNSYSTGDKPRILGSNATTWTAEGHTNIWQSTTSFTTNPWPEDINTNMGIWYEETNGDITWGNHKAYTADFANLVAEYDWCWNANIVYVYSVNDPDTEYTSVEVPQRGSCIAAGTAGNPRDYIEFNGFELAYSISGTGEQTYRVIQTGYILRNCEIHHLGSKDGAGYGSGLVYNNSLIEYNEIYECGRRSISIYNYGNDLVSDIIIQNNYLHNSWHTVSIDISAGGGGGSYDDGAFDGITIRNNIIEGPENLSYTNPPAGTYFSIEGYGYITNMKLYNNVTINTFSGFQYVSDYGSRGLSNTYIYNNTFHGVNKTAGGDRSAIFFGGRYGVPVYGSNIIVKNNIYYQDGDEDIMNCFCVILGTTYDKITSDHNLYYCSYATSHIVRQMDPLVDWHMSDFASMQSTWSWDVNSPTPADPLFVSSSDFHLQSGSPAKWTGVYIADVLTDIEGNPRHNPPSIGAYEFGSTDVVISGKIHHWSTV